MDWTKGEWIKQDKGSIEAKDGYPIAITYPDTRLSSIDSIARREANANLISVAPRMHEVCQKLVAWDNSHDDSRLISEACSLARLALQEAKGKEV